MTTELLTERSGSTLVMTLSGPATRNTLSAQVIAAGIETLNVAEANPDVTAVVITGAAGQFCAGSDLQHWVQPRNDLAVQAAYIDSFNQWVEALKTFPKPVIAAIEGAALGSGLALALACDMIVASETARFSAHSTSAGNAPIGGLTHALERTMGRSRALHFLWQTSPSSAHDCAQWGLIQELTPTGQAKQRALANLNSMTLGAGIVSGLKELVNEAPQQSWLGQLNMEKQQALLNMATGKAPGQLSS